MGYRDLPEESRKKNADEFEEKKFNNPDWWDDVYENEPQQEPSPMVKEAMERIERIQKEAGLR